MQTQMLELRLRLPETAPARLVEDIHTYNAHVELSARMRMSAPWYERLS